MYLPKGAARMDAKFYSRIYLLKASYPFWAIWAPLLFFERKKSIGGCRINAEFNAHILQKVSKVYQKSYTVNQQL